MSVQDRLQLIEAIWQTLDEGTFKEDEQELFLLQERLAEYKIQPSQTEDWEEFKDRMLKKVNGSK